jgi:hypothetical protein
MFITNYNLVNYANGNYSYALLSGLLLGVSSARHQDFSRCRFIALVVLVLLFILFLS